MELTLRQHARELYLRHARPMPHAARIHVHEGGAGCRIKADATALGPQACFAQLLERHAWDVEIDGLAQHVLAELGDPARASPQHRVGFGRAVSADDPNRLFGADLAMYLPEQVDQMGIHRDRL